MLRLGTHRCQGSERVRDHLVDLRLEGTGTDEVTVPIKRALSRQVGRTSCLYHRDVVVAGRRMQLLGVDAGDLLSHVRESAQRGANTHRNFPTGKHSAAT